MKIETWGENITPHDWAGGLWVIYIFCGCIFMNIYKNSEDQGQTLTQPEGFGTDNLNSPISTWPPATMAFWEENLIRVLICLSLHSQGMPGA